MQGRLRKEDLSVQVSSRCAHCSESLDLTIDSDMNVSVLQDTEPLIFSPDINPFNLEEPSIIEVF